MSKSAHRTRRGREKRRAERKRPRVTQLPYIQRKIPLMELLNEEGLDQIENNSEQILEEIGMDFRGDPEILGLWRDAGADVQGERVHIPRGLCKQALKTAPSQFIHYARNPERSVQIGGDAIVFAPVAGAPFVFDLDKGRRYGTLQDFQNLTRLVQMSPAMHHAGYFSCEPTDVAVNQRHLDLIYTLVRYTDKPIIGAHGQASQAEESLLMSRMVFGDDFVDDNVVSMVNVNVNSPLVLDETMMQLLKVYARQNQAVIITPAVLTGAMGPVTVAGCLAQLHAETLAGMSLVQLINPGAPVIYGGFIGSVSMQTGAPTFGTAENAHALMVIGQLARRLNIPVRSGGALTSSKTADAQAAYESMQMMLTSVMSGINLMFHSAGWLEGGLVTGYEKLIIDADRLVMLQRLAEGIDMSENAQAMEALREVGPGGHFLGCNHTQKNYLSAFQDSKLTDTSSFEQWQTEGNMTTEQRANKIWKQMLKEYEAPPLDVTIDEALQAFIQEKKASTADVLI
ncbi:MAG: trimethylamine methyltransferase family protein [Anaerolineae bacterium]|nr:trimethylamine methyltransferase family protein [Anaerolineae bacterium]